MSEKQLSWEEQLKEHFSPENIEKRRQAYEAKWIWLINTINISTGLLGLGIVYLVFFK